MTTHSFQCPSCGAPLLPRGAASVISCPHCHTSVVVPEDLRQESEEEQWITLVFENFASNENNWLVGSDTSDYFVPMQQTIADGRYRWDAVINRSSSMSTAWLRGYQVSDFHLTINAKHILGSKLDSSWGAVFRIQDNRNFYSFRMTDTQLFSISVVVDGQWQSLVDWIRTDAIKPNGLNQLEILARGSHFVFLINGQIVSEVDDNQYTHGLVGLSIEGYTIGERTVFDFIDITLRGRREETSKNS